MTEPVGQSPALTASLELLAAALCHDAQVEGYDHGSNPTLVSFSPAYCPRHLGIAADVRRSLATVRPPGDEAGLRAFARTLALESIPHEWGPGAQRHRRHVLRLLDDALATTPESAYANGRAALAAKPDPEGPGLDAERLRQALDAHMAAFVEQPESYDSSAAVAASIAAEYARLANPDREEPADG